MKRLLLTVGAAAMMFAGAASAADLPARTYTKAPPPVVEVYNWTGFYIGGNVGGVWERDSGTTNFFDPTGGVLLRP